MSERHFLSDNASGIHATVLEALCAANTGHAPAYGQDNWTVALEPVMHRHFGEQAQVLPVLTGTAANIIALASVLRPHEAVICADSSHLHRDECGAPERFLGCKLLTARSSEGKLTTDAIAPLLRDTDMVHRVAPRVVSVAQCTEWGTVYTPGELRSLADFCHDHGLLLHVDGARVCNAAAALNCSLHEITTACGVDLLSFGGSKNGLLAAEAVVALRPGLTDAAAYHQKQAMQLASKMRFVAAQLIALLEGDLWHDNAIHANRMAALLEAQVRDAVRIVMPVQSNAVFAQLNPAAIASLQQSHRFGLWDSGAGIVRWMTTFDTTEDDVRAFAADIVSICKQDSQS